MDNLRFQTSKVDKTKVPRNSRINESLNKVNSIVETVKKDVESLQSLNPDVRKELLGKIEALPINAQQHHRAAWKSPVRFTKSTPEKTEARAKAERRLDEVLQEAQHIQRLLSFPNNTEVIECYLSSGDIYYALNSRINESLNKVNSIVETVKKDVESLQSLNPDVRKELLDKIEALPINAQQHHQGAAWWKSPVRFTKSTLEKTEARAQAERRLDEVLQEAQHIQCLLSFPNNTEVIERYLSSGDTYYSLKEKEDVSAINEIINSIIAKIEKLPVAHEYKQNMESILNDLNDLKDSNEYVQSAREALLNNRAEALRYFRQTLKYFLKYQQLCDKRGKECIEQEEKYTLYQQLCNEQPDRFKSVGEQIRAETIAARDHQRKIRNGIQSKEIYEKIYEEIKNDYIILSSLKERRNAIQKIISSETNIEGKKLIYEELRVICQKYSNKYKYLCGQIEEKYSPLQERSENLKEEGDITISYVIKMFQDYQSFFRKRSDLMEDIKQNHSMYKNLCIKIGKKCLYLREENTSLIEEDENIQTIMREKLPQCKKFDQILRENFNSFEAAISTYHQKASEAKSNLQSQLERDNNGVYSILNDCFENLTTNSSLYLELLNPRDSNLMSLSEERYEKYDPNDFFEVLNNINRKTTLPYSNDTPSDIRDYNSFLYWTTQNIKEVLTQISSSSDDKAGRAPLSGV